MNLNLPSKSYIKTYEEKKKASNEVSELYESGLSFLSKVLGKLHGINSDQRYWEIILGLWLREISVIYIDRSKVVNDLDIYQKNELKKAFKGSRFIPKNYKEFSSSIETNAALATLLFSRTDMSEDDFYFLSNFSKTSSFTEFNQDGLWNKAKYFFYKSLIRLRSNLILYTIEGCSGFDKAKIYFLTLGKAIPYVENSSPCNTEDNLQCSLRKNLLLDIKNDIKHPNAEFYIFLIKSLPCSYLENFKNLREKKKNEIGVAPKKIFLDSRFRVEDEFKILLAEWCSRGTKTYVFQHSLNCLIDFDSSFQNDLTFDYYIYWDSLNDSEKKCSSIRLNKFVKNYRTKFKMENKFNLLQSLKNLENDLYVCRTVTNNQGGSLAVTVRDSQSIKEGRLRLSESELNFEKKIVVRIRPGDIFGEDNVKTNFSSSNNLFFSQSNQSIQELYNGSRINIFEGLSMGVTECLALNRPFLVLNYNSYIDLRCSRLKHLFNELKNLNIVHDNIETLNSMLTNDYVDRFYSSEFQKEIARISETYFPVKENYLKDLIDLLKAKND